MIGRVALVSVGRKPDQRPRDLSKVRQWMWHIKKGFPGSCTCKHQGHESWEYVWYIWGTARMFMQRKVAYDIVKRAKSEIM